MPQTNKQTTLRDFTGAAPAGVGGFSRITTHKPCTRPFTCLTVRVRGLGRTSMQPAMLGSQKRINSSLLRVADVPSWARSSKHTFQGDHSDIDSRLCDFRPLPHSAQKSPEQRGSRGAENDWRSASELDFGKMGYQRLYQVEGQMSDRFKILTPVIRVVNARCRHKPIVNLILPFRRQSRPWVFDIPSSV